MALKITDQTTRIISAALGSPTNGTAAFWFRRSAQSLAAGPSIFRLGSSSPRVWEYASVPTLRRRGATQDNAFSIAEGAWAYLAITKSGSTFAFYGFTDTSAETVTTVHTSAYVGPTTLDTVEFGDVIGAYGDGYANMELLDCRVWNSVLTTAQLNTEKNSATAVITSGLLLSASLESALTAQTGTDLSVVTGTGYSFTSNVPTARSGGASVVHPALLTTRQHIAFAQTF